MVGGVGAAPWLTGGTATVGGTPAEEGGAATYVPQRGHLSTPPGNGVPHTVHVIVMSPYYSVQMNVIINSMMRKMMALPAKTSTILNGQKIAYTMPISIF
jgi:hypothetical protein